MLLEEFRNHMDDENLTTEDMDAVTSAYILLGFDKDDFCKIIKTLGLDKWKKSQAKFEYALKAVDELRAKEKYIAAKNRLEENREESNRLQQQIEAYERDMKGI